MGETTKIAWTDSTFNPWRGCEKVSRGCANCYAETQSKRNPALLGIWGPPGVGKRVVAAESCWRLPLAWNREAERAGVRRRVFVASLADVFEDWTGPIHNHRGKVEEDVSMDDVRRSLFRLIDFTPWLDWQIVTKRPENILRMWPRRKDVTYTPEAGTLNDWPENYRPNVWLLASAEDQPRFEERIPHLLACRDLVPVLGLSCEPLLEPLDLRAKIPPYYTAHLQHDRINWIIIGGESGSDARKCDVAWIRSIARQCRDADIACFVKQLGSNPRMGKSEYGVEVGALKTIHPKGGDPAEWPEDLRIQQFPEVRNG